MLYFSKKKYHHKIKQKGCFVSLLQIFPNADLRLLKHCVSVRDRLLQKQYEQHKVRLLPAIESFGYIFKVGDYVYIYGRVNDLYDMVDIYDRYFEYHK